MKDFIENIIGVENVGMNDNLFECGVDSIKIMLLAHKLKKHGYSVSIQSIMKVPTIKSIWDSINDN